MRCIVGWAHVIRSPAAARRSAVGSLPVPVLAGTGHRPRSRPERGDRALRGPWSSPPCRATPPRSPSAPACRVIVDREANPFTPPLRDACRTCVGIETHDPAALAAPRPRRRHRRARRPEVGHGGLISQTMQRFGGDVVEGQARRVRPVRRKRPRLGPGAPALLVDTSATGRLEHDAHASTRSPASQALVSLGRSATPSPP